MMDALKINYITRVKIANNRRSIGHLFNVDGAKFQSFTFQLIWTEKAIKLLFLVFRFILICRNSIEMSAVCHRPHLAPIDNIW